MAAIFIIYVAVARDLCPNISNYINYEIWDEIIYRFSNFNVCTLEVWECISDFIPHLMGHVVIYLSWELSLSMLGFRMIGKP